MSTIEQSPGACSSTLSTLGSAPHNKRRELNRQSDNAAADGLGLLHTETQPSEPSRKIFKRLSRGLSPRDGNESPDGPSRSRLLARSGWTETTHDARHEGIWKQSNRPLKPTAYVDSVHELLSAASRVAVVSDVAVVRQGVVSMATHSALPESKT
jgi:hypothetical protein